MSSAKDRFKAGGSTQAVSSMPSSPLLQVREKVGSFVSGTFLSRKDGIKMKKGLASILNIKIADTDMDAVIKEGNDYVPTTIAKGDIVGILAPTRLARQFEQINAGDEVYIEYLGQDTEAEGEPHVYDVLRKKASAKVAAKAAVDDEVM